MSYNWKFEVSKVFKSQDLFMQVYRSYYFHCHSYSAINLNKIQFFKKIKKKLKRKSLCQMKLISIVILCLCYVCWRAITSASLFNQLFFNHHMPAWRATTSASTITQRPRSGTEDLRLPKNFCVSLAEEKRLNPARGTIPSIRITCTRMRLARDHPTPLTVSGVLYIVTVSFVSLDQIHKKYEVHTSWTYFISL